MPLGQTPRFHQSSLGTCQLHRGTLSPPGQKLGNPGFYSPYADSSLVRHTSPWRIPVQPMPSPMRPYGNKSPSSRPRARSVSASLRTMRYRRASKCSHASASKYTTTCSKHPNDTTYKANGCAHSAPIRRASLATFRPEKPHTSATSTPTKKIPRATNLNRYSRPHLARTSHSRLVNRTGSMVSPVDVRLAFRALGSLHRRSLAWQQRPPP